MFVYSIDLNGLNKLISVRKFDRIELLESNEWIREDNTKDEPETA